MYCTRLILCLSFLCIVICSCNARSKLREVAYLYDFQPCPDFPVTGYFNASYVYGGKDDFRVNIELTVNKTYETVGAFFECSICPTREKRDCEKFLSFPVDDYCTFEDSVGDWNLILGHIEPPLKCPIKGGYVLKDYSISEAIPAVKKFLGIGLLSTDNTIYYNRLIMRSKGENIMCLEMGGSFRLMRFKGS